MIRSWHIALVAALAAGPARAEPLPEIIAILDLQLLNSDLDEASREVFLDTVRTQAGDRLRSSGYTVLNKENTLRILEDNDVDVKKACEEASCAVDTGRQLNAKVIVSGTVTSDNGLHAISVRAMETANGQQIKSIKVKGRTAAELSSAFEERAAEFFAPLGSFAAIKGIPKGGRVRIGRLDLTADADSQPVPPGPAKVVFESPCHEKREREITFERRKTVPVEWDAPERTLELTVVTVDDVGDSLDAEIEVDDRKVGMAPGPFQLKGCVRQIDAKVKGYEAPWYDLPENVGAKHTATIKLTPRSGPTKVAVAAIRAGISPSTGVIGAGLEFRPLRMVGVHVGYGTNLTAGLSVSRSLAKGGLYADAHFAMGTRSGVGGLQTRELGGGLTVGWDWRFVDHLSIKTGVGAAYSPQNEGAAEPRYLVFDAAVGAVF